MHKKCSGIKGKLSGTEKFSCKFCSTVEVQSPRNIATNGEKFQTVPTSCYIGYVTGQPERYTNAVTAHIHSTWKVLNELLPVLTNQGISLVSR